MMLRRSTCRPGARLSPRRLSVLARLWSNLWHHSPDPHSSHTDPLQQFLSSRCAESRPGRIVQKQSSAAPSDVDILELLVKRRSSASGQGTEVTEKLQTIEHVQYAVPQPLSKASAREQLIGLVGNRSNSARASAPINKITVESTEAVALGVASSYPKEALCFQEETFSSPEQTATTIEVKDISKNILEEAGKKKIDKIAERSSQSFSLSESTSTGSRKLDKELLFDSLVQNLLAECSKMEKRTSLNTSTSSISPVSKSAVSSDSAFRDPFAAFVASFQPGFTESLSTPPNLDSSQSLSSTFHSLATSFPSKDVSKATSPGVVNSKSSSSTPFSSLFTDEKAIGGKDTNDIHLSSESQGYDIGPLFNFSAIPESAPSDSFDSVYFGSAPSFSKTSPSQRTSLPKSSHIFGLSGASKFRSGAGWSCGVGVRSLSIGSNSSTSMSSTSGSDGSTASPKGTSDNVNGSTSQSLQSVSSLFGSISSPTTTSSDSSSFSDLLKQFKASSSDPSLKGDLTNAFKPKDFSAKTSSQSNGPRTRSGTSDFFADSQFGFTPVRDSRNARFGHGEEVVSSPADSLRKSQLFDSGHFKHSSNPNSRFQGHSSFGGASFSQEQRNSFVATPEPSPLANMIDGIGFQTPSVAKSQAQMWGSDQRSKQFTPVPRTESQKPTNLEKAPPKKSVTPKHVKNSLKPSAGVVRDPNLKKVVDVVRRMILKNIGVVKVKLVVDSPLELVAKSLGVSFAALAAIASVVEKSWGIREISREELKAAQYMYNNESHKALLTSMKTRILNSDLLSAIAEEIGLDYELITLEGSTVSEVVAEKRNSASLSSKETIRRPPVVSVLGHVNHGKTTVLDWFRAEKERIAPKEAGGITQKIGSFQVGMGEQRSTVTLFDTPGHSLFSAMRENVSKVTDIAVLVVAVDSGVLAQTREAISLILAHGLPTVVAITKCDLEGYDVDHIKQQLKEEGLKLEDDGGDVIVVEISARTGRGMDDLQEAILLTAEMQDLDTELEASSEAIVVETSMVKGQGHVVHAVVKQGHLNIGDKIVIGKKIETVKTMLDSAGSPVSSVGPSFPVVLRGVDAVPEVGSVIVGVNKNIHRKDVISIDKGSQELSMYDEYGFIRTEPLTEAGNDEENPSNSVEDIEKLDEGVLGLIVKGDQAGSIQSILDYVSKLPIVGKHRVVVVDSGIGNITKSDVLVAERSGSMIVGFNVSMSNDVRNVLKKNSEMSISTSKIVYDLLDTIDNAFLKMLPERYEMQRIGKAQVMKVFNVTFDKEKKKTPIAGCTLMSGRLEFSEGAAVRVYRNHALIGEFPLRSLRKFKDSVDVVTEGDCGVATWDFTDFEAGDVLECVVRKHLPKTQEWLHAVVEKSTQESMRDRVWESRNH